MDSVISVIIVVGVPLAIVVALLWRLRARWGTESLSVTAYEVIARYVPGPPRSPAGLRRGLARRACSLSEPLPSGARIVPEVIEIPLAPKDLEMLAVRVPLSELENDLTDLAVRNASVRGWQLPEGGTQVLLASSELTRPGWIPGAHPRRADTHRDIVGFPPHNSAPPPRSGQSSSAEALTVPMPKAEPVAPTIPLRPPIQLMGPDGAVHVLLTDARIGRDPACDIVVQHELVSRFHAQIWATPDGWQIEDLASSNGTYLDGNPLESSIRSRLRTGSEIRLGSSGPVLRTEKQPGPDRSSTSR